MFPVVSLSVARLGGLAPGEVMVVNNKVQRISMRLALSVLAGPELCFTGKETGTQGELRATPLVQASAGLESRPFGFLGRVQNSLFIGILLFYGSKKPPGNAPAQYRCEPFKGT